MKDHAAFNRFVDLPESKPLAELINELSESDAIMLQCMFESFAESFSDSEIKERNNRISSLSATVLSLKNQLNKWVWVYDSHKQGGLEEARELMDIYAQQSKELFNK